MLYGRPSVDDSKEEVWVVYGHVRHALTLHGLKPGLLLVGAVVECTSMSLKFVGLLKAAMGGSGMAFLHLSDRCSIGRYVLMMVEMFGRAGLYVTTNGILCACVSVFLRLSSAWGLGVSMALLIAASICFCLYPRCLRWVVSSVSLVLSASSVEQILTSLKAKLYGMLCLVWCGWHEPQCK